MRSGAAKRFAYPVEPAMVAWIDGRAVARTGKPSPTSGQMISILQNLGSAPSLVSNQKLVLYRSWIGPVDEVHESRRTVLLEMCSTALADDLG